MRSGRTKEHFHEKADISKTCFYECALPNRRVFWLISNSQYTCYVHWQLSKEKDLTHTYFKTTVPRDWNQYFVLLILVFLVYIVETYVVHIYTHKFLGSGRGIFLLFCLYGIWRREKMGINSFLHKFMIIWFLMQNLTRLSIIHHSVPVMKLAVQ